MTKFGLPLLTCTALLSLASTANAAEPYGLWVRPSTGSHVRFYDCSGKLCGKVVAVQDQSRKGEIGKMIMHGAKKTGTNTWEGDLTDVGTGKTYSGIATLEGPNALNLKGCVMGILCKGETWSRLK